jgi:hypothetical protein
VLTSKYILVVQCPPYNHLLRNYLMTEDSPLKHLEVFDNSTRRLKQNNVISIMNCNLAGHLINLSFSNKHKILIFEMAYMTTIEKFHDSSQTDLLKTIQLSVPVLQFFHPNAILLDKSTPSTFQLK